MKKQSLLYFSFLFIALTLGAQTSPLVLVSQQGELSYKGESKKNLDIAPGALLSINGHLKLKDKSTAVLLCNEGFNVLMSGKVDLKKLCGDSVSVKSLGLDGSFSQSILSSVELAYVAKDQNSGWINVKDAKMNAGDGWGAGEKGGWGAGEKGGWGAGEKGGWGAGEKGGWGAGEKGGWGAGEKGGWGAGEKGGWGAGEKGGWGGNGNSIHLIMPFGKATGKSVRFSWSKPANANSFMLRIMDANQVVLDSMVVKDTFAMVDLTRKTMVAGEHYSWNVTAMGDSPISSNTLMFAPMAGDAKKAIQSKISKSKIYYKLDPVAKMLMEAVAYEQEQMYYHAADTYMKTKKQDSKNNLAKMMHAAFWMRGGMTILADSAMNPQKNIETLND